VVLAVTYRLTRDGAPAIRYADLERDLERRGISRPSLADVRGSVLAIRRSKSMVLDPHDPNRRSCGSFFLNPIVDAVALAQVERAVGEPSMPRWPEAGGGPSSRRRGSSSARVFGAARPGTGGALHAPQPGHRVPGRRSRV
jgi:UDP-N-acetylmuramate dehydrogenase